MEVDTYIHSRNDTWRHEPLAAAYGCQGVYFPSRFAFTSGWTSHSGTVSSQRGVRFVLSLNKKGMRFRSGLSGTFFEIKNPAGNCPKYGHGLFGLEVVPALGKNPVVIL